MEDDLKSDAAGDGSIEPAKDLAAGATHFPLAALRRRLVELLIVFVGVYAAFLLNRLDTDHRDTKRRLQILDALAREVSANVSELKHDVGQADEQLAAFDRQLAGGEMPRLGISFTNSGYSASDDATLLQAGGLELLDVQTVERLRKANTLQRTLLAGTHNLFELSLAVLANHKTEDFYDPATKQLRLEYAWYPRVLHNTLAEAKDVLNAEELLLEQIRREQHSYKAFANPALSPAGHTTP